MQLIRWQYSVTVHVQGYDGLSTERTFTEVLGTSALNAFEQAKAMVHAAEVALVTSVRSGCAWETQLVDVDPKPDAFVRSPAGFCALVMQRRYRVQAPNGEFMFTACSLARATELAQAEFQHAPLQVTPTDGYLPVAQWIAADNH